MPDDINKPSEAERILSSAKDGCKLGATLLKSLGGCFLGAHIGAGYKFIEILNSDASEPKSAPNKPQVNRTRSNEPQPVSESKSQNTR